MTQRLRPDKEQNNTNHDHRDVRHIIGIRYSIHSQLYTIALSEGISNDSSNSIGNGIGNSNSNSNSISRGENFFLLKFVPISARRQCGPFFCTVGGPLQETNS